MTHCCFASLDSSVFRRFSRAGRSASTESSPEDAAKCLSWEVGTWDSVKGCFSGSLMLVLHCDSVNSVSAASLCQMRDDLLRLSPEAAAFIVVQPSQARSDSASARAEKVAKLAALLCPCCTRKMTCFVEYECPDLLAQVVLCEAIGQGICSDMRSDNRNGADGMSTDMQHFLDDSSLCTLSRFGRTMPRDFRGSIGCSQWHCSRTKVIERCPFTKVRHMRHMSHMG